MICCLTFSALFLRFKPYRGATWFFGVSSAIIFLSVVTSYTRASYLSLAAAVAVMSLAISRRFFVTAALAGALLAGGLFATNDGFRHRVTSIFDLDYTSNSERVNMWRAHLAMFKDHPILGVGLHDNERRNAEYNIKLGQEEAFTGNAHSNYIQFLAGTGIVGLSFYLLFIFYYLRLSWKLWKKKEEYTPFGQTLILGIGGAQVSFHIAGIVDNNFKDTEVNHPYIFMLAILTSQSLGLLKKEPPHHEP